jgi:hypothetical protein
LLCKQDTGVKPVVERNQMILADMADIAQAALDARTVGQPGETNPMVYVPFPVTITSHDLGSSSAHSQAMVATEVTRTVNTLTANGFDLRQIARRWIQSTGPSVVTHSAVVELTAPADAVRAFTKKHRRPPALHDKL